MTPADYYQYLELCPSVTQRGGIVSYPEGYQRRVNEYLHPPTGTAFRSMFMYDESYLEHFNRKRTVSGYTGVVWARDAIADLDDNESLENALDGVRKLVLKLTRSYYVPAAAIRVAFSGGRGFHISLPQSLIGFAPSRSLPAEMSNFWRMLLDGCLPETTKFDDSIYGINKLIRVTGSYHEKSKRYKIPLTPSEVMRIKVDDMLALAGKRRVLLGGAVRPQVNEPMGMTWHLATQPQPALRQPVMNGTVDSAIAPNLGKSLPVADLLNQPVKPGDRNNTAFKIASYLVRHHHGPGEVDALLQMWNRQLPEPLPEAELHQVIRSAERSRSG